MFPSENFDKNSAIWCNLGIPKYVISILKINNFKVTKSTTTEINCHIFSPTNIDVHAILKLCYLELKRGVGGWWLPPPPQKQENFLKIKQNGGFSFIFFLLFGKAS